MICVGAMLGDSTSSIESNKEGFPIFNGGTLFKDPELNMLLHKRKSLFKPNTRFLETRLLVKSGKNIGFRKAIHLNLF